MKFLGGFRLGGAKPFLEGIRGVPQDLHLRFVRLQGIAQLLDGAGVTILFFDHQNLQVDHANPPRKPWTLLM